MMALCAIGFAQTKNVSAQTKNISSQTKSVSRGDTEKGFISALNKKDIIDSVNFVIDLDSLVPYGENLYILPGRSYQNAEIRNSVYVHKQVNVTPVWSAAFPGESIANMFLFPSEIYYNVPLRMKVIKHEYGEQEDVSTTVGKLLAVAKAEGCMPYWGVEHCDSNKLVGALFLYNKGKGYVHVLNVTCNPSEVIGKKGAVNARTSLYVPTSNISRLIAPYKKKTANQIIKYDKK